MAPNDATLSFYSKNAAAYASQAPNKAYLKRLASFADQLPPRGKVLDLGSGGGHATAAFLEREFEVTAIDASKELAAEATRRTGMPVRVMDLEQLEYESTFDGVWASASLLHVPSPRLAAVMGAIGTALKPNGYLYASFKERDEDWTDRLGRSFCAMTVDLLRAYLEKAGFSVEAIDRIPSTGADGEPTVWLLGTACWSS